jgi:hypothetical protein
MVLDNRQTEDNNGLKSTVSVLGSMAVVAGAIGFAGQALAMSTNLSVLGNGNLAASALVQNGGMAQMSVVNSDTGSVGSERTAEAHLSTSTVVQPSSISTSVSPLMTAGIAAPGMTGMR